MRIFIMFCFLFGFVFGNDDWDVSPEQCSDDLITTESVLVTLPEKVTLPDFLTHQRHIPGIAKEVDVVAVIRQMATDIGNDLQDYNGKFSLKIAQKFSNMVYFISTMSAEQILEAGDYIYTPHNQDIKHNARAQAWLTYRDAVFESGTQACSKAIKKWIDTYKLQQIKAIS